MHVWKCKFSGHKKYYYNITVCLMHLSIFNGDRNLKLGEKVVNVPRTLKGLQRFHGEFAEAL